MALSEQRAKDARMASSLKEAGILHGMRRTSPAPNSGGTTMVFQQGSSRNQRRLKLGPYRNRR